MGSGAGRDALSQRVAAVVEPLTVGTGLDLEDVVVTPAGRRRVLRVVVDAEEGVGVEEMATLSHEISAALEVGEVMGAGAYVLEVTSPGVDRPLLCPRHWRRARGRMVRAELADGQVLRGRVLDADDTEVTLDLDDGEQRSLAHDLVATGRVEVEFSRPPEAAAEQPRPDGLAAGGQV